MYAVAVLGKAHAWTALLAVLTQGLDLVALDLVQLEEAKLVLLLHVGLLLWGLLGLLLSLFVLTGTVDWGNGDECAVLLELAEDGVLREDAAGGEQGDGLEEMSKLLGSHCWRNIDALGVFGCLYEELHNQKKWSGDKQHLLYTQ